MRTNDLGPEPTATGGLEARGERTIGGSYAESAEYRRILGLDVKGGSLEPAWVTSLVTVTTTEAGLLLDLRQAWAMRPGQEH